nr:RNA-dependent RNA polymerase [Sarcosphaera coronaria partitivirus]
MPVLSTLRRFEVYKNLRYLHTIKEKRLQRFGQWDWDQDAKTKRDDWVIRKMRKHYPEETVQKVLTFRRSNGDDEAVIKDFFTNEQPIHHVDRDYHYERALRVVKEQMKPRRILHPVSFPDLRAYPHTLNVSAELPWTNPEFSFVPLDLRDVDLETGKPRLPERPAKLQKFTNRIKVPAYLRWKQELELIKDNSPSFHNLYNEIFVYNRGLIHEIKAKGPSFWDGDIPIPYERLKLHLRTHVVPEDKPDKVRAVFGAPKLLLMSELMFIWPLQATYQNTNVGKLFWQREIGKGGWRKLLTEMHSVRSSTYISMDWSGFDRRLLHEMMDDVHNIWRSYFDFSQYEPTTRYPDPQVNPDKIENLWQWMTHSVKRTPIELPNGQVWQWTHNGFGSGYQQTQLMDTFVNMIMTYTVLSSLGVNIESEDFKARFQGDDAILAFPETKYFQFGRYFLSMMAEKAMHYFNAKLSDDKSGIGDHPNSLYALGYNNRYGRPIREDEDLLSHLMFPERPQDFGRLAASASGLAYASLGCSRPFYKLCEEIWTSIVVEKEIEPDWKMLRWMKRAGMEEVLDKMMNSSFPSFSDLLSMGIDYLPRTEQERQRSWPTQSTDVRGEIVFINNV